MNKKFTKWMGTLFKKPDSKATCCECVKSLQLMVDGEATKEQEAYFLSHMNECLPCYNFYELEKQVKSILQNKIEKKPCPPHLASNIREKLRKPL